METFLKNNSLRLIISVSVGFAIHLAIFIVPPIINSATGGGSPPPGGGSAQPMKLKVVEMKTKTPKLPTPKGNEKPVRTTSNDEKLEENDGALKPTENAAASKREKTQKEQEIKNPVLSKANAKSAKFVNVKTLEKKAKKEPVVDILKEADKLSKKEKETVQSSLSQSDYTRYLASMKVGKMKGVPTPRLLFAYFDTNEIIQVHKYFGIKIVGLDMKNPHQVVEVTALGTDSVDYQKINKFNWKNYSNRIFPRTEPFFNKYKTAIVNKNVLKPNNIRLLSITPNGVDSYFRYKQIEVLQQNNINPDNTSDVIGRFHKTSFGSWILVIEKVKLKTGNIVSVKDFELEKVGN